MHAETGEQQATSKQCGEELEKSPRAPGVAAFHRHQHQHLAGGRGAGNGEFNQESPVCRTDIQLIGLPLAICPCKSPRSTVTINKRIYTALSSNVGYVHLYWRRKTHTLFHAKPNSPTEYIGRITAILCHDVIILRFNCHYTMNTSSRSVILIYKSSLPWHRRSHSFSKNHCCFLLLDHAVKP